jgi:hypothetical protein
MNTTKPSGLDLLRAPFPDHQVSKLPKGTKAQNDCPPGEKRNCAICGGWHHPKIIHLDYVGHAAVTDRLLDADPKWSWEPMALTPEGLPLFSSGGLWIKLTVCGVTRLGYGHAQAKNFGDPGSREKEVIGDAVRNAAMRFGAALELWHKGELHAPEQDNDKTVSVVDVPPDVTSEALGLLADIDEAKSIAAVEAAVKKLRTGWDRFKTVKGLADAITIKKATAFDRIRGTAS